jgi:nicotinate (nicotinamide) nucleotide adenylyltransferase
VGVLAGSFHPITRAHEALAKAALSAVDEVVFAMPRRFPHKAYEWVGLEDRIELVRRVADQAAGLSVAVTEGGLFVEMAREARAHYGDAELWFICGADAAERIVGWNYGHGCGIQSQLGEFGLLVAERQTRYAPPEELADRIRHLEMGQDWSELSSTEIRRRIVEGMNWEHLVPEGIAEHVARVYRK